MVNLYEYEQRINRYGGSEKKELIIKTENFIWSKFQIKLEN